MEPAKKPGKKSSSTDTTSSSLNTGNTFKTSKTTFTKEAFGRNAKILADSIYKTYQFDVIKPYFHMEVPRLVRYDIKPDHTTVAYQRYEAIDLIDLIIKDNKKQLDRVILKLERNLSSRRFKEEDHQLVNRDPFVAAIRKMSKDMDSDSQNDKLFRDLCSQIERSIKRFYYIPYRLCHGNMCFDNMMFSTDAIYVCSPRFVPIESVIWDIAKLRQDTKHLITFRYRSFKEGSKNYTRIVDFCHRLEEMMLPIWQAQKSFIECYEDIAKLAWLDTYHHTNNEKVKERALEVLQNGK
jgi:hypothetical protein